MFSHRLWLTLVLPAFFLSAQHATLPLIFDPRFILWRGLMFFPCVLVLFWHAKPLPYLIVAVYCSGCGSTSSRHLHSPDP